MDDLKNHWNGVYDSKETSQLGWYEDDPNPSYQLIEELDLDKGDKILDIGCGATKLIDKLVASGYSNIIGVDISASALDILRERIDADITLIEDDIRQPTKVGGLTGVKLWHDRAALHFIQEEKFKKNYVETIRKVVETNGYVIIATFSLEGAEKCSGLPVHRYSTQMLKELLGKDFQLVKDLDFLYRNPSGGERPYVYTVFQKIR